MSPAFASITSAMAAQLSAAPAVSAQIHRARMRVLPQGWTTAVVVRPVQAQAQRGEGMGTHIIWTTQMAVECYARSVATVTPDLTVDALLRSAVDRVLSDPTLAGAAGDIGLDAITFDFDVDGESTACATVVLNVRHVTASNQITL